MFWDSSALVPLLHSQQRSTALLALLSGDAGPAIWWGSPIECASAIYRRHRQHPLPSPLLRQTLTRLDWLAEDVAVVTPSERVRIRARRILATHSLRAADSLQLAAALVWSRDQAPDESFVCLDERLRDAAAREGFRLLPE